MVITRRSADDIEAMKRAGAILSGAMEEARRLLVPGVTTGEVDQAAEEFIYGKDAKPLFKGYRGFPAATCISVNEEVVHGIPGRRMVNAGDIVS
ncbi:MAG: M24 family metallopeptidase, partial [Planctomycetes bacterium]|nr:M24 family metallopeptidase [Planctomycetota bacterium]